MRKVLVTGYAGSIGFHLSQVPLADGFQARDFDGLANCSDIERKTRHHPISQRYKLADAIREFLGKNTIRNYMDMQTEDVTARRAVAGSLRKLTPHRPQTDFHESGDRFVRWLLELRGEKAE